jgi:hypothetical protein
VPKSNPPKFKTKEFNYKVMEITFAQILVIALGLAAIIKYILDIYRGVDKPNADQDLEIRSIRENCSGRSAVIDKVFGEISKRLDFIEQNSLKHIEADVKELGKQMVRIETTLDERLPKKQ